MTIQLSSLRVDAALRVSDYTAPMAAKVAADNAGVASSQSLGEAIVQTDTKISRSGTGLTALQRKYVPGAGDALRFTDAIRQLGKGLDTGNISMQQAEGVLDGLQLKFGIAAESTALAARGQTALATAVEQSNLRLLEQQRLKPANIIDTSNLQAVATAIVRTENEYKAAASSIGASTAKISSGISSIPSMSAGAQSFQTHNIAAQLQDVIVSAQGGQHVSSIALQQGFQLASAFGDHGATGAVKALGGAFVSLLNPVSLVTVGAVAAGAAMIQYFSEAGDGASKTAEALQEQDQLIRNVASAWGDAVPALKAYVDQLDRTQTVTDTLAAGKDAGDMQFTEARKSVADLNVQLADTVLQMQTAGASYDTISKLTTAWNSVSKAVQDGRDDTKAMGDVQDALSEGIAQTGLPALTLLANGFDILRGKIAAAARQATTFNSEAIAAIAGGSTVQDIVSGNTFTAPGGRTVQANTFLPETGPRPEKRPNIELEGLPGADKIDKAAEKSANAYRDVIKSAQDRVDQMKLEASTAGETGIAADTLSFKLKILQDASDKGRTVTEAHRIEISKLADAYRDAATAAASAKLGEDIAFQQRQMGRSTTDQTVAATLRSAGLPEDLNSTNAQLVRSNENLKAARDLAGDFASTLTDGLRQGEGLFKSLGNAAVSVLNKIGDSIENNLINQLFGAGGSSGLGSIPPIGTTLNLNLMGKS